MYQKDPRLDELLKQPLKMSIDDDEYEYDDEYDDEDDEDLFGDDVLAAAIEEREAQEAEASAFAASLLGASAEPEEPAEMEIPEAAAPEPAPTLFSRGGIERRLFGYGLLTLFGFVPLVLLTVFAASFGLSGAMKLYYVAFFAGTIVSLYNLYYLSKERRSYTTSFNIRTYFRFFPEVIVISVVLVALAFVNISSMSKGKGFTLSGQPLPTQSKMVDTDDSDIVYSSEDRTRNMGKIYSESPEKIPAGAAVGLIGSEEKVADKYDSLFEKPVSGSAAGYVGGKKIPSSYLPDEEGQSTGSGSPLIDKFFLGGALCAALGYAFVIGIAGLLLGLLRPFETPFSQKYLEIVNIETGEITSDSQPVAPAMKPLNVAVRGLIGLTFGGTLGFLMGLLLIVPLSLFFKGALFNPNVSPLLNSLGFVNNPDLAFANAFTVGALMVPLIIGVVTKAAPQGLSVSEKDVRDQYEIKPSGRFVGAGEMGPGGEIPNPAIISFDNQLLPDDELEKELSISNLMREQSLEEDTLLSEIVEDYGKEFESIFGIDTRDLILQPRQKKAVSKKVLSQALDESFGELGNVPVEISAELGQATIPVTEWLNIKEGTLVLLSKPADEDIDILFNGIKKGKGKLMVEENSLAVKVSHTTLQENNGNHIQDLV